MTWYLDGLAFTRASGSDFVWLGTDRNGIPGAVYNRTDFYRTQREAVGQANVAM